MTAKPKEDSMTDVKPTTGAGAGEGSPDRGQPHEHMFCQCSDETCIEEYCVGDKCHYWTGYGMSGRPCAQPRSAHEAAPCTQSHCWSPDHHSMNCPARQPAAGGGEAEGESCKHGPHGVCAECYQGDSAQAACARQQAYDAGSKDVAFVECSCLKCAPPATPAAEGPARCPAGHPEGGTLQTGEPFEGLPTFRVVCNSEDCDWNTGWRGAAMKANGAWNTNWAKTKALLSRAFDAEAALASRDREVAGLKAKLDALDRYLAGGSAEGVPEHIVAHAIAQRDKVAALRDKLAEAEKRSCASCASAVKQEYEARWAAESRAERAEQEVAQLKTITTAIRVDRKRADDEHLELLGKLERAEQERDAERAACVNDVCMYCSGRAPGWDRAVGPNEASNWTHTHMVQLRPAVLCQASSIYARVAGFYALAARAKALQT